MKHRKAKWVPDAPVAANARRELPLLAREYFEAGRKLSGGRASAAKMHRFRLLTKHLRYTLEVFRPVYGPAMDGYLAQLKKVQTVLGELNDYASTRELMRGAPEARHRDTATLLRLLDERERGKRREFASLWREDFDRAGQQKRWESYFARYGRDPRTDV